MALVRLVVVANEVEAETIAGLLRTEGIDSVHRFTDVGAGAGDATGSGGPREVLVEAEDLERARELVGSD
jgi:Putative prokaryotic signal transducing protein